MEENKYMDLIACICMEDEEFWKSEKKSEKKHHFSAAYQRRKREMVREMRRKTDKDIYGLLAMYPVRKIRAFVTLVLLLILLMGIAITAKELHLKYYQNMEIRGMEDHVEFVSAAQMKPSDVEQVKVTEEMTVVPQYVPEGYECHSDEIQNALDCRRISYVDDSEKSIYYIQTCSLDDIGITSDGREPIDVMVNDWEGVVIPDGSHNSLLWNDGTFYYLITGPLSREELLRMAESVE